MEKMSARRMARVDRVIVMHGRGRRKRWKETVREYEGERDGGMLELRALC